MNAQAHEDGPVYYPAACILSLGSSAVMNFRRKSHDGEATEKLQFGILHLTSNMQALLSVAPVLVY